MYIRLNNNYVEVSGIYKKVASGWVEYSDWNISDYRYFLYEGTIKSTNSITILCSQKITGESSQLNLLYNRTNVSSENVEWTIISGNEFVTISDSGLLTILENADESSIVVHAKYNSLNDERIITVTYKSGTSQETQTTTNEDGTITETNITTNEDGSSTSNSITTDENGNITGESTKTTNSDGSSTEVQISYNEDGTQTQNTTNVDTSGNSSTQTKDIDENGNEVVTGYTIDTTNNEDGGLEINDGVDTGVIAFSGDPFKIHLKAIFDVSENTGCPIICAAEKLDTGKYAGYELLIYDSTRLMTYATTSGGYYRTNGVLGSQLNTYKTLTDSTPSLMQYLHSGRIEYTIDIEYIPTNNEKNTKKQILLNVYPLYTSTSGNTVISNSEFMTRQNQSIIPNELKNATISIGEFNGNNSHKMKNLEILEFSVKKIYE